MDHSSPSKLVKLPNPCSKQLKTLFTFPPMQPNGCQQSFLKRECVSCNHAAEGERQD